MLTYRYMSFNGDRKPHGIIESPLKTFKAELKNSMKCVECNKSTMKYCDQCHAPYCNPCFTKIHSSGKVLKLHVLGQKCNDLKKIGLCEKHPNQETVYSCIQCNVDYCLKCQNAHATHKKVTIESMVSFGTKTNYYYTF